MKIQAKILTFIPPDTLTRTFKRGLCAYAICTKKSPCFTVASSIQYKVQLMANTDLIILVAIAD